MVRHHLDILPMQNPILFLSYHVLDPCLLCGEIIPDLLHRVGFPTLFHDWLTCDYTCAILGPACKKCLCLKVILHIVCCEFHV